MNISISRVCRTAGYNEKSRHAVHFYCSPHILSCSDVCFPNIFYSIFQAPFLQSHGAAAEGFIKGKKKFSFT